MAGSHKNAMSLINDRYNDTFSHAARSSDQFEQIAFLLRREDSPLARLLLLLLFETTT